MIGEITTTKLRVLGMQGHSNCNSLAGHQPLLLAHPDMAPIHFAIGDATRHYYDNIFVFTEPHGWPGAGGTPPEYAITDGEWLEMTANCPTSPTAAHPHPSPFMYPNTTGWQVPNHQLEGATGNRGDGGMSGVELPLLWRLSHYWSDQLGLVKLAVPGSRFLRFDFGETEIGRAHV